MKDESLINSLFTFYLLFFGENIFFMQVILPENARRLWGVSEKGRGDSTSGFFVSSRRKTEGLAGLNRRQYRIIRVKDGEMDLRRMRIADFAGVPAVRQESCKQQTA